MFYQARRPQPDGFNQNKTAIFLLDGLEKAQNFSPKTHQIIECSSGNIGITLSIICKERGYKFICVCDPNVAPKSQEIYAAVESA